MTCAKISELLPDFIMEELPPDLNEVVNKHLQNCATCRSEQLALNEVTSQLQAMAHQIAPPEYLSNQLEQMMVAEIGASVQNNKWWRPKFIVQIAATFLIMFAGWGILDNQSDSNKDSENVEVPNAIVLEQVEQPSKEVQDTTLLEPTIPKAATEPMREVEPEPEMATKSFTPPETVEILRRDVAEEHNFSVAQTQTIILDTVQQVNIKLINENETVITRENNLEVMAMIVEGINNPLPSDQDAINASEVTHIITIQCDNGDNYKLNYCLVENIGFGEGNLNSGVLHPGASLSLALEQL